MSTVDGQRQPAAAGRETRYFGGLAADSYGTPGGRPPLVLLHGLTYDRRQWTPMLRELATIDPGRRVLSLDLPGHGESPERDSYHSDEVAAAVHAAVTDAGLDAPVVVGHSLGAVVATVYAATYRAGGVVDVDQPLLPGRFADVLRQNEPALRGRGYAQVWQAMLAGMHIELLPAAAQELVRTATTVRQDLLLGYWDELLATPAEEIEKRRVRDLDAIRSRGIWYRYVASSEPSEPYRHWLESALSAITITVVPGGGHFPHLARPAELARIVAG